VFFELCAAGSPSLARLGLSHASESYRKHEVSNYFSRALELHTDNADVIGMLCCNKPCSGGHSTVASSMAIHNAMLASEPEHVDALHQAFHYRFYQYHRLKEDYFSLPVFSEQDGFFACYFLKQTLRKAQECPKIPRLSQQALSAIETFAGYSEDDNFQIVIPLDVGDILFINNLVCVHGRESFIDGPDASQRRHMLRTWHSVTNARPLAPSWHAGAYGQTPRDGAWWL